MTPNAGDDSVPYNSEADRVASGEVGSGVRFRPYGGSPERRISESRFPEEAEGPYGSYRGFFGASRFSPQDGPGSFRRRRDASGSPDRFSRFGSPDRFDEGQYGPYEEEGSSRPLDPSWDDNYRYRRGYDYPGRENFGRAYGRSGTGYYGRGYGTDSYYSGQGDRGDYDRPEYYRGSDYRREQGSPEIRGDYGYGSQRYGSYGNPSQRSRYGYGRYGRDFSRYSGDYGSYGNLRDQSPYGYAGRYGEESGRGNYGGWYGPSSYEGPFARYDEYDDGFYSPERFQGYRRPFGLYSFQRRSNLPGDFSPYRYGQFGYERSEGGSPFWYRRGPYGRWEFDQERYWSNRRPAQFGYGSRYGGYGNYGGYGRYGGYGSYDTSDGYGPSGGYSWYGPGETYSSRPYGPYGYYGNRSYEGYGDRRDYDWYRDQYRGNRSLYDGYQQGSYEREGPYSPVEQFGFEGARGSRYGVPFSPYSRYYPY